MTTISESIAKFDICFSTDEACYSFFYNIKWPEGFRCPRCNHHSAYRIASRLSDLYQCYSCRHQTTLTAGTLMDKSRTPLRKWLLVLFLISLHQIQISAVQVALALHITYKTAWSMLHKIRQFISRADEHEKLSGVIKAAVELYAKKQYSPNHDSPKECSIVIACSSSFCSASHFKFKVISSANLNERRLLRSGVEDFARNYVTGTYMNDIIIHPLYRMADSRFLRRQYKRSIIKLNACFKGIGAIHLQSYLDYICFFLNHPNLDHYSLLQKLTSSCLGRPLSKNDLLPY
ncbi:Transposase zinc-ribbon domain-containing protein [Paenibacillus algorifonticola]|uniref:Transposase zinc-ribbon domain-containing protein n=1 Tax=Paenibacillus algorifonticola TaxID=684063 RepID=A0A1I2B5Z6_9BACL|nr:transposase [Paenibacillus algorifonticola]SFE51328.1 Transposase zinc-ribbon domain-containing protein [Paenibacillus algorifonticola]